MNKYQKIPIVIAGIFFQLLIMVFAPSAPAQTGEESFLDAGDWVQVDMLQKKLEEVPLAISVITDEEIRESGATSLADLFRRLPGMDVMQTTAASFDVCSRGFNRTWSNKMLVLLDGRTVYLDVMGMVWWESLDISLGEIRRIEVIRSSGSALYGANAFSGVINIVTKTPQEIGGTEAAATVGEKNTYLGSVMHAGRVGELAYKASAGWNQTGKWRDPDSNSLQIAKAHMFFSHPVKGDSEISFEGGFILARDLEIFYDVLGPMTDKDASQPHLRLAYRSPNLRVGAFWTGGHGDIEMRIRDLPLMANVLEIFAIPEELLNAKLILKDFDLDTYDLDLRHNLRLGPFGKITWGGGYRLNTVTMNPPGTINEQWGMTMNKFMDRTYRGIQIGSAFLNDEVEIRRNLSLLAGIRMDYNSKFGFNYSPQGSLIFAPVLDHTLYLAASNTYRTPNHYEAFLDVPVEVLGVTLQVSGEEDLRPERIASVELGYRFLPSPKTVMNANVFYGYAYDLIHSPLITDVFEAVNHPYVMWDNFGEIQLVGGELEAKGEILPWLSGFANYSFQYLENVLDDPATAGVDEAGTRVKTAPLHKVNAGFTFKPGRGLSASVSGHYVTATDWSSLSALTTVGGVPAYKLFNARIGYRFWKNRAEVSVAAANLLDNQHREFSFSEKIGRKITGSARVEF